MNGRILLTIAYKDLKELRQNRAAWIPILVVPLIFVVVLPLLIILAPGLLRFSTVSPFGGSNPVETMTKIPALAAELAGLSAKQIWLVVMTGYFFAPFILIMPLMFSTVAGADSFAGEKERKTIEALLHTPASDGELFLGKVLAAVVPAVALAWTSFLVYAAVVNLAGRPVMGRFWFPPAAWWPLMLWVAPAVAVLGMAVTVLVSAKAGTFMGAYQMSATLVLLVLALVIGQAAGVLYLDTRTALAVGLVIWLADAVLVRLGVRRFRREALLARL